MTTDARPLTLMRNTKAYGADLDGFHTSVDQGETSWASRFCCAAAARTPQRDASIGTAV